MILLINNANDINHKYDPVSFAKYIIKCLRTLKIPYHSVRKIEPLPTNIKNQIKGIIMTGSNLMLTDPEMEYKLYEHNLHYMQMFPNVPIYGLCFSCQLLALHHGGKLHTHDKYFKRTVDTELDTKCPLFVGFEKNHPFKYWFSNEVIPHSKKMERAWATTHDGRRMPVCFEFRKNVFGSLLHPEFRENTYLVYYNFAKLCGM